jgi:hypothetical protein
VIVNFLAFVLLVNTDAGNPPADPWYVMSAIEAVASKDAKSIRQIFRSVKELNADGESWITAPQALELLSGCTRTGAHHLAHETYTIDYKCPARRKEAKGCDTGDLFVMVTMEEARSDFVVAHRRKFSDACPLYVPAPPSTGGRS